MNEILMKIDTEIFEISENDYYTKEAKENVIKGLVKAKEIIQAEWKATPTIIINLPSLSDQDIEDYKDKLKEIFDEKEKYEQKDLMTDYYQAREIIKQYCQNEDCTEDCKECTYPLSAIRCGEETEYKTEQKENNRIESHTVKTKGGVIRESNENLADYIIKFTVLADKQRVIDYLNQPVESEERP